MMAKGEADKGKGPVDLCPAERVRQGRRTLDRQAERDREAQTGGG
jgi:hypothetical protein